MPSAAPGQPPIQENDPGFEEVQFAGAASTPADPRSYKEAMRSPDALRWEEATQQEIISLMANGTWEIVDLPPDVKPLHSGWVFKVKLNSDGSVERHKARLVVKGCGQCPGIDYSEVFSPTFRPATLRLVLAIAAVEDMHLRSIDISSAFTYGELEEDIYMLQPEGFHHGGPQKVCKLKKSLYGLKQAARQWNKKLHSILISMGFARVEVDRSLYTYQRNDVKIYVPIWIDDITFSSSNTTSVDRAIAELATHFKLRDLGETKYLLGVEISRDRSTRSISLSQRQYILSMLERYGMADCHSVQTPAVVGLNLSKAMGPQTQAERDHMRNVPYLSAVGSLQYLATMTRPDIAYTVSLLGRFSSNPGPEHWAAVKHLLRYLKGTVDLKLTYSGSIGRDIFTSYCDASHGDCKDTGRSSGGYCTIMAGGAIGWSSKLQPVATLSTCEAEYIQAVEAGKEIKWMRYLLGELGYKFSAPSPLLIDNAGAVSVTKNPEHHGRMKHLDLRFFWLREAVETGVITTIDIPGTEQPADIFTKPLPLAKIEFCRTQMGLS